MEVQTIICVVASVLAAHAHAKYEPTWDSLDKRPLPAWYDEAKFGIFIHWGVWSVPSYGGEAAWFWYGLRTQKIKAYLDFMKNNYPPGYKYEDFAPMFTAELYNPYEWADIFKASGARWVVVYKTF